MSKDITQILRVLQAYESSPSAHCLVRCVTERRALSNQEIEAIYELSEADNDMCTDILLHMMTAEQIRDMKYCLKTIKDEYPDDEDKEYAEANAIVNAW